MYISNFIIKYCSALILLVLCISRANAVCPCEANKEPTNGNPTQRAAVDYSLKVPFGFTASDSKTDPATKLPIRIKHIGTGYELVLISGGEFWMGSPSGKGNSDEHPAHRVKISPFWIGVTEITQLQFHSGNSNRVGSTNIQSNYPVVNVTWNEAHNWCRLNGMRLPTEAEWEFAARGKNGLRYPWGNVWRENAGNFSGSIKEAGKYLRGKSPFGVLDMAGNAYEWCSDFYSENYYSVSIFENPGGPAQGSYKVIRGISSINDTLNGYGITERRFAASDYKSDILGFRAAVTPWR